MKIAVFCSANNNIDPDFFAMTEEMGKWMAENGQPRVWRLQYWFDELHR